MNIDIEKLLLLLSDTPDRICELILNVLNDSEDDPHYSAVMAVNRIKCYIDVMESLGEHLPYGNVKEFFSFYSYTDEDFAEFEKKRESESEYYIGNQY